MVTRIASANIKRGLGWSPLQDATQRLLNRNVGIIGFQEIYGNRIKRLRKMLARKGYGLALAQDVPIAYDLRRYKLMASNSRRLPGKASRDNSNPARFGNWVALRDRRTGQTTVLTNTHLSRKRTPAERRMQRQQVRELGDLQRDLVKRFGEDADYFITGDMNTGRRRNLRGLGLRGHRVQGHPIDWIFSENSPRKKSSMRTASDHDTFIATFRDDGRTRGGKGGRNNDNDEPRDLTPGAPTPNEQRDDLDAFELFADLLESWGIPVGGDIEKIIKDAMLEGYTPDQIHLLIPDIQNTRSWKKRFPGWHQRVANGYNQLAVEEYLQMENAYHRILQGAGLPAGFYDDPSDFGAWIANDVSINEVQERVSLATDAALKVDPTMREIMARFYGLTTGDVAAYFLDQDRALPAIKHQYQTAGIASYAAKHGFVVNDIGRYEELSTSGVTPESAMQGYGTVRAFADSFGRIASTYGETYDQRDAEQDVFFNDDEKRRRLSSAERGTFSGRSEGSTGSADRSSY